MIWVTWRQFRTQAIAGAIALAAAAIHLLLLGLSIHSDYDRSLAGCIATGCAPGLVSGFTDTYSTILMLTDLAWHQSVTRTRWLTVKLLVVGFAAVTLT